MTYLNIRDVTPVSNVNHSFHSLLILTILIPLDIKRVSHASGTNYSSSTV
jgi:hypothetical protein